MLLIKTPSEKYLQLAEKLAVKNMERGIKAHEAIQGPQENMKTDRRERYFDYND